MRLILPLLFLLSVLACNKPKAVAEKVYSNDTTEVLKLAADSAIRHVNYESLYLFSPFRDSIVLVKENYAKFLPEIKGIKVKIMTRDEICDYVTLHQDDKNSNFLEAVYIGMHTFGDTLCIPSLHKQIFTPCFDKLGKPFIDITTGEPYKGNKKCDFGSICGNGGYYIEVAKKNGCLSVKRAYYN